MREVAEEVTVTSGMEFTLEKTFFNGKVFFETYYQHYKIGLKQ